MAELYQRNGHIPDKVSTRNLTAISGRLILTSRSCFPNYILILSLQHKTATGAIKTDTFHWHTVNMTILS